jgi:glycosyltransferase involved in cell wall biosynthesis
MNRTSAYRFTIIIPVFNEEDNISPLADRLSSFLPQCRERACVLFVDDGSTDGSGAAIKEACAHNPDFFHIGFAKNCGLSAALKAGIDCTESELLGYMDADLQTAPEDFNLLLEHLDGHYMATGIRTGRKDSVFKRMQSKFANGFRRMFTRDGAEDTGCPLKVLRTDAARRLPFFNGMHRFLPALILLQEGGSYVQVPVRHFPRKAGKSKFHLWNRLLGPLSDCFAYQWMKKRSIRYCIMESDLK